MKRNPSPDDVIPMASTAIARYRITVEDQTFDVCVLDDPRHERVRVQVDGETFTVGVEDVSPAADDAAVPATPVTPSPTGGPISAGAPVEAAAAGPVLKAPLPGVIKSIVVQPGQEVAVGDELLVIEAMKMDNVIRASRAGIVDQIHVTEAGQVAHGDPLLEFVH